MVIVQRHAPAALPLGGRCGTPSVGAWVGHSAGLDGWGKTSPSAAFDPRTVYPVASRYNDCTIRGLLRLWDQYETTLNEWNECKCRLYVAPQSNLGPDHVNVAISRLPVWHSDIQPFIPKICWNSFHQVTVFRRMNDILGKCLKSCLSVMLIQRYIKR